MEIWLIAAVVVTAAVAVYALLNRGRGEVIEAPQQPRPATPTPSSVSTSPRRPTPEPADEDEDEDDIPSAGDLLAAEGGDERLERLADWLEVEASEELGVDMFGPEPTRRIADAARAAMRDILERGRAVVELTGLDVDGAPGRVFRREVDRAQLDHIVASAMTAGDLLKAEGGDEPLEHFADWLENEASVELDDATFEPGPTRRIADAARAAMPVILAQGRGVVDLPGLLVDASGARGFRRELDVAALERAVVETGHFDIHDLTAWRGDPTRVTALAAWLDDEVLDDMPLDGDIVEDDAVRLVEASRRAVADIDRTGHADIVLVAIGSDGDGKPFDTRRSIDAERLRTLTEGFEEDERNTIRTRTRE